MYVSIAEVKAAGLCTDKSDAEITSYITAASAKLEVWTGHFFEPRQYDIHLSCNGGRRIFLPYRVSSLTSINVGGIAINLSDVFITQDGWVLERCKGWGDGIITISGVFGVVNENGEAPMLIKEVMLRLIARESIPIGDIDGQKELALSVRVTAETTDGHSYSLAAPPNIGVIGTYGYWTGDTAIDSIIAAYQRPPAIGAA